MPHLIVFSHLRWSFVYQRPQHLLTRLASHYQVCYVEEPVFEAGDAFLEVNAGGPGIDVLVPHTSIQAPGYHDDQLSAVAPLLHSHLRAKGINDYIVWFYTPMALPLLSEMQPRAVVYDCMDELAAFKDAPRQLRQRETALMKRADVVLAGGPALYEAKADLHPNVHCLPSAVDAAHFSPDRLAPDPGPHATDVAELHKLIDHPRLGFYGVIDERLDIPLLAQLAESHPDWQLVMVGPVVKIDPATLPQNSNIHWLGMQSYDRLPHLAASWDVCLLPFALNDSTRFISPTKTLEYMAAGKPVVSTAVRDVSLLYGDVVRIATDHATFIAACEGALAETPTDTHDRLQRMALTVARYSWDTTAATIRHLVDKATAVRSAVDRESHERSAPLDEVTTAPASESAAMRFGT